MFVTAFDFLADRCSAQMEELSDPGVSRDTMRSFVTGSAELSQSIGDTASLDCRLEERDFIPPEDARGAAPSVPSKVSSGFFNARTCRMPSTRLAYVATKAAIDAAVIVQSIHRGQYMRATLRNAKQIVLRALSENEDVREKARQSALRAKRETQRELDARIQNTRRKVSELEQVVNYASAKQAKAMRKDAVRMRRDLDELKRTRFEVEQAKPDVYSEGEMRLGKPLKFETDVVCAMQTRIVRDGCVRVRLALSIRTRCERADTITQLRERAMLQSCGILRGGVRSSQIRGLATELRAIELQQLIVWQLVRAGMPKWWGWPLSGKHAEKALAGEREKNWRAATAQYSELLETARTALMAAVDRLLRSCIMRALYARRRRAVKRQLREAKAVQLQCACRVWLARRKRKALSVNPTAAALRERRARAQHLWAHVRESVCAGLRDHTEHTQRRMAARTVQLAWRIQTYRRQEECRLTVSASQHLAAKRIGLFWQAGHGKEHMQLSRVRAREAQYQRELKRGRALLRKAERLQREADENEGATTRRSASARAAIGSPAASPRRLHPPSPTHRPQAKLAVHQCPQPPQQARNRSTTSRIGSPRTKQLLDGQAEAGRLSSTEVGATPRSVPATQPPGHPVRATTAPMGSPCLPQCASPRLPVVRRTQGGVRVSVRRPGHGPAGATSVGCGTSPRLSSREAASVPEWSDVSLDHNGQPIIGLPTAPGRPWCSVPERSSARGLLTPRTVPAGTVASPRRARDIPPRPPVQPLTAAQHAAAESIARRLALGYALKEAELHLLRMAHAETRGGELTAQSPAPRAPPASPPQPPVVQTPRARHTMAVADARALWRMVDAPLPNSILAKAESNTWEMVQRYAVPPPPCEAPAIDELDMRIQLFSDSQPDMVSAEKALAQLWKDSRLQAAAFKEKREELAKWRDDWRRWTAGCAMRRRLLAAEEAHQGRLRAAERARRERMRRWLWEDQSAILVQRSWRDRQRRRIGRLVELEASLAWLRRKSEMEQAEANGKREAAERAEKARLAREAEAARLAEEDTPVDWASLTMQICGQLDAALSPFHARKAELDEQDRRRAEEERGSREEGAEGEMVPSPSRKLNVRNSLLTSASPPMAHAAPIPRKSMVTLPPQTSAPAPSAIHRLVTPMPPRRVPSTPRSLRGGSRTQLDLV